MSIWIALQASVSHASDVSAITAAIDRAEATFDRARIMGTSDLEAHYDDALDAARTLDDPAATAAVHYQIAEAARTRGYAQMALFQYERGLAALQGRKVRGASATRAWAPGAKTFASQEAIAQDLEWPVPRSVGAWTGQSRALESALLINIGTLYEQQGQLTQATEAYTAAQTLADAQGDAELQGIVRVNRAWLALRQGKPSEAIKALQELDDLRMTRSRSKKIALRSAWLARGEGLVQESDYASAIKVLKTAERLYESAEDTAGLGLVLVEQAEALQGVGQTDAALAAYEKAALDPHGDVRWAAPLGAARLHRAAGRQAEAMAAYRSYLKAIRAQAQGFRTDEGRFTILESHSDNFDDVVELATEMGDPAVVYEVVREVRLRSLPSLIGRPTPDRTPGTLPPDRFAMTFEVAEARPMRMMEQRAASTSLGPRLSSGGDDRSLSGASWNTPIPPSTTVVSFTVLDDRVVITGRTASKTPFFATREIEAEALRTEIRDLRAGIGAAGDILAASRGIDAIDLSADGAGERAPRHLYDVLLAPIAEHLPSGDGQLVLVPDGPLWMLPFGALTDPSGTPFSTRAYTLAASEGAIGAIQARPRPTGRRLLALGNPGAGKVWGCSTEVRFEGLPHAEQEVTDIGALPQWSQADVLTGIQGDALRLDAWHSDYDVVHLATHGLACPGSPLSSFLLLGQPDLDVFQSKGDRVVRRDDPRLPVRRQGGRGPAEVDRLDATLTARHVVDQWSLKADLVTLSACETGLGQASSEGVIGLSRAFLAAGARSLLVSLWPVEDEPTRVLMTSFYEGYLDHGDKALALRDAIGATRKRFPEPRQWAAFMLVGAAR